MTVVYLDVLFLLNVVVDYLLLLATVRLAGEPIQRIRLGLGALVGGVYAALTVLPGLIFLTHPACKGAAALLMALTAFGGSRRLLRLVLLFGGLACALGGGVLAIALVGRRGLSMGGGVLYTGMDLKIVLLSAAACYAVITVLFRGMARHTAARREVVPATLGIEGRTLGLTVLLDTGNTLSDPATGRPVMVAEARAVAPLLPALKGLDGDLLRRPVEGLAALAAAGEARRFRLLPYRTVGVEGGLLLTVRVDRARVGERDWDGLLVALSPNPISEGGGYVAVIGT